MAAWSRFLLWQVRSRLQSEVVWPWVGGQRLAVRRGMTGATGNVYLGLHEWVDMLLVLHFLREGDLFFDIGANVGSYTILASGVRGARTWAFEPDPATARLMRRNIALNGLEGKVRVFERALGASEGEVGFTIGLDTVNHVVQSGHAAVRRVAQSRLDDVAGGSCPILLKMDVEGYEDEVLKGAHRLLADPVLRVMLVETVSPDAEARFAAHGFVRVHYDPLSRTLQETPTAEPASNALFVRDAAEVQARLRWAPPVRVLGRAF
ncbi:FkbM family methyltransferase [Aquabacter spiritensis]|nr:FkbM family methyltransferase [Aquabacter spiritensis]